MNIELNKTYIDKVGRHVTIVAIYGTHFIGLIGEDRFIGYYSDGRCLDNSSTCDLFKEYKEPITRSIDVIWTAPSRTSGNIPAPQIVPKGFTPAHSEGKIIKRETVSCTYYPE